MLGFRKPLFRNLCSGRTCAHNVATRLARAMLRAVVELFESEKEQKEGKRRRAFPDLTVVYFFKPDEDEKTVSLICRDFEDPLVLDSRDWIEKCFPCIFKGIPAVCVAAKACTCMRVCFCVRARVNTTQLHAL